MATVALEPHLVQTRELSTVSRARGLNFRKARARGKGTARTWRLTWLYCSRGEIAYVRMRFKDNRGTFTWQPPREGSTVTAYFAGPPTVSWTPGVGWAMGCQLVEVPYV